MAQETLSLINGHRMPVVGLGLWKIENSQVPGVVRAAIDAGYRHLDCACDYGNEVEVGLGLQQAVSSGTCTREQLWVTSKLWNTYHSPDHVRPALERSLRDLQLDYLDLYLIHFPIALEFVPFDKRYPPGWFHDPNVENPRMKPVAIPIAETWRAMEELVTAGLVRNIGVCNFNTALLRDLISYAEIPPAVLQVESHPFLTQEKLLRFCHEQQVAMTAFSPLGAASYYSIGMADEAESVLEEEVVREIAAQHHKTPAQVVLRWGIQRRTAVIPKTSRVDRLRENLDIFNFQLSADQMDAISGLNRNRRFNDPGEFCEKAFNTFFPIYE